jgi:hypothetical protein
LLLQWPRSMYLSTADLRNYRTEFHETWWNYRYMFLVDPKVFRFVVKGVKAIFFYPHTKCRVLAAILKMADILKNFKTQNCSSNGDLSLCQILCLYLLLLCLFIIIIFIFIILSFREAWTCPRQISGTTGQNFMKLGGIIDIYF